MENKNNFKSLFYQNYTSSGFQAGSDPHRQVRRSRAGDLDAELFRLGQVEAGHGGEDNVLLGAVDNRGGLHLGGVEVAVGSLGSSG